ncbi:MAG: hypothetical protein RLZZ71_445 [Bacteroidota bacterium]|jgi:hypothetical protein
MNVLAIVVYFAKDWFYRKAASMKNTTILILFLALAIVLKSEEAFSQAIPVTVSQDASGAWQMIRDGKPYEVRGAGGSVQLDKLIEIGGNSIRTWSTDNAQEVLDEAHSKGLTVMLGLWVQHERHGFDYNDEKKVAAQLEGFKKVILQFKDHPALLMWGIGNEVDLFYSNIRVWAAINDIAKFIHQVDPNHPTSTVTAGLDEKEVKLILRDAPEIDVYCVNTYGDIAGVRKNIRNFGWQGPYMITEWGPNGHWEVAKTKWGAPVEQSSSEKAKSYRERLTKEIQADKDFCIGSYVFLWGHKQETTSTWYGLFSAEGNASEAVEVLQDIWKPGTVKNRTPVLDSVLVNGKKKGEYIALTADEIYEATAFVKDADNDLLKSAWVIVPESRDIKSGGDAESAPTPIAGLFKKKTTSTARFFAPSVEGAYRLFFETVDGNGHYAYTNVPFYVMPRKEGQAPKRAVSFKRIEFQP